MTEAGDGSRGGFWSCRSSSLAATAALFGVAAFTGAMVLAALQARMPPAGYFRYLSWLAPEIGLAPIGAAIGLAAAVLSGSSRNARSAALGLLGSGLAIAAIFIALTHRPPNAAEMKIRALENVRKIATALTVYESDYQALPPAAHWMQALGDYVNDPAVWDDLYTGRAGYALNAAVAGRTPDAFVTDTAPIVAVFEADRGGATGGRELLPLHPRHQGGDIIGFLDGHAAWVVRPKDTKLDDWPIWNPDASTPGKPESPRSGRE